MNYFTSINFKNHTNRKTNKRQFLRMFQNWLKKKKEKRQTNFKEPSDTKVR